MKNGLYKVEFHTQLGAGYGVVALHEGELRGGDSMMFYRGTYAQNGDHFSAQVDVDTHTHQPGMHSVLGVQRAQLILEGVSTGGHAQTKGTTPQAPGVTFQAHLTRISD